MGKKISFFCIGIILFVGVFFPFTAVFGQSPPQTRHVFVKLKSKLKAKSLLTLQKSAPLSILSGGLPTSDFVIMRTSGDVQKALDQIQKNPDVETAFIAPRMKVFSLSNDLYLANQWGLAQMKVAGNATTAWDKISDISNKTAQVKVAVIDSGIDRTHPDLSGKIASGDWVRCGWHDIALEDYQQCIGDTTGIDDFGHGTHVAGIIAAVTDNNAGIAGVAWNVKLMSIKVLDNQGVGDMAAALFGMSWAADHGAKVINMSLGTEDVPSQAAIDFFQSNVNAVLAKGVVIVAAAGNCGNSSICNAAVINAKSYPAANTGVISVAALAPNLQLAIYSQHNDFAHGNWISVAAPGGLCTSSNPTTCIFSTWSRSASQAECAGAVTNAYCYAQGTSMAAPHVAGLAALLFAANPTFSNTQVKQIIESSANHAIAGSGTNYGAVDALSALTSAGSSNTPTVTVTHAPVSITPTPTGFSSGFPTMTPPPPSNVTCQVPPGRALGNANGDCTVDEWDLQEWIREYFDIPANKNADFSSDNKIDLKDFEIWRRNYGTGFPSLTPIFSLTLTPTQILPSQTPTLPGATRTPTPIPPSVTHTPPSMTPRPPTQTPPVPTATLPAQVNKTILALGDSITRGIAVRFGWWPCELKDKLGSGYTFVGSVLPMPEFGTSCANVHHEGWGGFTTANILSGGGAIDGSGLHFSGALSTAQAYHPDILLLFLGTNDINSGMTPDSILNNLQLIISYFKNANPAVRIYLAKITPWNGFIGTKSNVQVVELNNRIGQKNDWGSYVTVVDQYTGFDPAADLLDVVHPNASGNTKIAQKFYEAMIR